MYLYTVALETPSNNEISLYVNEREMRYSSCSLLMSNLGLPITPSAVTGVWYAQLTLESRMSSYSSHWTRTDVKHASNNTTYLHHRTQFEL